MAFNWALNRKFERWNPAAKSKLSFCPFGLSWLEFSTVPIPFSSRLFYAYLTSFLPGFADLIATVRSAVQVPKRLLLPESITLLYSLSRAKKPQKKRRKKDQ